MKMMRCSCVMFISVSLIISGCKSAHNRETTVNPLAGKVEVSFAPGVNGACDLVIFNGTDKGLWIDVDKSLFVLDVENRDDISLHLFPEQMVGASEGYYFYVKPWQNVRSADHIPIRLYCDRAVDFDRSHLIRWDLALYDGRVLRGTYVVGSQNSSRMNNANLGNAKNLNSHNINNQKKQSFHKVSHAQILAFEEAEKELRVGGIVFTNQLPKGWHPGKVSRSHP